MTIPYWLDSPEDWSTIKLGPYTLPGDGTVVCKASRDYDIKKTAGNNLATMDDKGNNLAEVTITVRMWEQDHLNSWFEIYPQLKNQANNPNAPLGINHPNTNMEKVEAVVFKDATHPMPDIHFWTITINCIQWAPKPVPAKTSNTVKQGNSNNTNANNTPSQNFKNPPNTASGMAERLTPNNPYFR